MAQSGYTPISLYFSATGAAVPTAANLVAGELALNTNDGKLYFKNSAGVVTLLAGSTSGPAGGSNTQVQYNNSGVLAGITGATTNGTVLTLVTPVLGVATATSLQGIIGNVTPAAGNFTTLGASSTATLNTLVSSGATLTGGTINGMTVGATTATTGAFTSLTASTTLGVTGVSTLTGGAVVQGLTVGLGAGAVAGNTAVGVSALAANTSGAGNTALGDRPLFTNLTGSSNTAVGSVALYASTGDFNTAVGAASLRFNTADNNTAVGYQAGYTLSAVANQTFLGYQAGYSRSTGADNYSTVMVGNLAGYSTATGVDNTYVGGYAARYQTGSTNTALGGGAFYGASGTSTGSNNTAIGYTALYSNTTASNNTAVGYQAGYSNTTGAFNAFFGRLAGYSNTTANAVTAIGNGAANANTTGANTTAVGSEALLLNTTGAYNTAVGSNALNSNTTASNNTAVGYQAAYSNTESAAQTALGYQALYNITGAFNGGNTALGQGAGFTQTSGYTNTYVGYNSGYSMIGGIKNTILGSFSGNQGGLDIRNSSNYIVLSDGDGNPLISTANSQTVALKGAVPNSGTGITFPASDSPSSNANTLDDYEEGTFTAGIAFGGAAVGVTYDMTPTCTYTKIGRQVTVTGRVGLSSKGSSTGDATVTGLIFTPANTGNAGYGAPALAFGAGTTFSNVFQGVIVPNSTSIVLQQVTVAGTNSSLTDTNFSNSSNLLFTATYFV